MSRSRFYVRELRFTLCTHLDSLYNNFRMNVCTYLYTRILYYDYASNKSVSKRSNLKFYFTTLLFSVVVLIFNGFDSWCGFDKIVP